MGRPKGTKNVMRTSEEKEKIVCEYLNSNVGYRVIANKYDISETLFRKWIKAYIAKGVDGFRRKIGSGNPGVSKNKKKQSRLEQLEQENIKLKIEVERLKKGYYVKGDGARKEYVTSLEKNTK